MRWIAIALLIFGCTSEQDPVPDLRSEAARITWMLEEFLGPKFERRPVPLEILPREQVATHVREYMDRFWSRDEQRIWAALVERLYLVQKGFDPIASEVRLYSQGAGGFYDPEENRYYVVEGVPPGPELAEVIAHELVHAYRDVDCDYNARQIAAARIDADWELGIRCLVEGDASLVGMALAYSATEMIEPEKALEAAADFSDEKRGDWLAEIDDPDLGKDYPLYQRELLFAPYAEGIVLAARLFRRGGVAALAAAYERPPRSTEQVLHPEKYLGPEIDEPMEFSGNDPTGALGGGWTQALTNVMGELFLRLLFTEVLGRETAVAAAAGWDGDRFWFCTKPGKASVIALVSTWDDAREAKEFADAWARWAAKRDGEGPDPVRRPDGFWVSTAEGLVEVRRVGADVLIVDGVSPGSEEAVLERLARAARRERKPSATPLPPR